MYPDNATPLPYWPLLEGNPMTLRVLAILWSVLLVLALLPAPTWSQELECIQPAGCVFSAAPAGIHPFALRLKYGDLTPAPGISVRIEGPASATVIVHNDSAGVEGFLTDSAGMVTGYLRGSLRAGDRLGAAVVPGGTFPYREQIVAVSDVARLIPTGLGSAYYWFPGSQIRDVEVRSTGITAEACPRTAVRFAPTAGSGTVSPDSAYGHYDATSADCVFRTDWRLGPRAGAHLLNAQIGRTPPVAVRAIARNPATVQVALAAALRFGFSDVHTLTSEELSRYRVQRTDPSGSVIAFDSISVQEDVAHRGTFVFEPIPLVLLNTPLRRNWERIRAAFGFSLTRPQEDFFAGLALRQMLARVLAEDSGFDIIGGFLVARPERLADPVACRVALALDSAERGAECATTQSLRFDGAAVMVSADASALITAFRSMLGF